MLNVRLVGISNFNHIVFYINKDTIFKDKFKEFLWFNLADFFFTHRVYHQSHNLQRKKLLIG